MLDFYTGTFDTLQNAIFRHIVWVPRESSQCVFDRCLTVDEWINLVNSSNVITKGKARLNRKSMLNGRDRHQQTLTTRKVAVLYWRAGLHWGVGVGGWPSLAWWYIPHDNIHQINTRKCPIQTQCG